MIRAMDTIQWNAYSILFFYFWWCVRIALSLSFSPFIRLFASNLNFPFGYLFDSFIVVVAFLHFVVFCFILCSFFIYLSISFCRSWITLLFWLWPRPRAHTLYSSWSLFTHTHTQIHRYFLCRQRFSFKIFSIIFSAWRYLLSVKWIFEWNYDECFGHCK